MPSWTCRFHDGIRFLNSQHPQQAKYHNLVQPSKIQVLYNHYVPFDEKHKLTCQRISHEDFWYSISYRRITEPGTYERVQNPLGTPKEIAARSFAKRAI